MTSENLDTEGIQEDGSRSTGTTTAQNSGVQNEAGGEVPNGSSFWQQTTNLFLRPANKYIRTIFFFVFQPVEFGRFLQKIYSQSNDDQLQGSDPPGKRAELILMPVSYLVTTTTFSILLSAPLLGSDSSKLLDGVQQYVYFVGVSFVIAVYMTITTWEYKRFKFYFYYFCYLIGTFQVLTTAAVLLLVTITLLFFFSNALPPAIDEFNPPKDPFFLWAFCSVALLWVWICVYVYAVHPILTFFYVLKVDVYRLIFFYGFLWIFILSAIAVYFLLNFDHP